MDYVVFGIGFGATILVLGLMLRDLGPRLRYRRRNDDGVLPADVLVAKVAWDRFCNALGAVLAIGGILFLIITFVCIVLMLADATGGWVMLASLAVFFLLILYWTWAFFDRFGAYGILPERPAVEEEPAPAPAPANAASEGADKRPLPAGRPAVTGPTLEEAGIAPEPEAPPADEADSDTGEEAEAAEEEPETPAEQAEATDEAPVVTPEERLARMEEPIEHGSAAGDLDSGQGVARPASNRTPAAEDPAPAPEDADSAETEAHGDSEEDTARPDAAEPDDGSDADERRTTDTR